VSVVSESSNGGARGGAVFLSYASQDAEAAQNICDALRASGIEVWFDQSELRGGDAWDQKIRREIHECALFIPIISATGLVSLKDDPMLKNLQHVARFASLLRKMNLPE
jgi:hypothetical protein